jgi:hypothetical protein
VFPILYTGDLSLFFLVSWDSILGMLLLNILTDTKESENGNIIAQ